MVINVKKIIIAIACYQIIGCASLKYPNWEKVSIESSVINKPCESKLRLAEHCNDDDCNTWFKKRATIYNANTIVRHKNNYASYFYCAAGLPLYQNPVAEKTKTTQSESIPANSPLLITPALKSISISQIPVQEDINYGGVPQKSNVPQTAPVQKDFSNNITSSAENIPNENALLGGIYKWGMTADQIVEASKGAVSKFNDGEQIARGRFSTGKFEFIAAFFSENGSALDHVILGLTDGMSQIYNQLWDALSAKYGNGEIINSNVHPDSGLKSDMEVSTRTIRWKTNTETISLHQLILPMGIGMDISIIYKKIDSDLKL